MAPKKPKTLSTVGQGEQSTASVFDFLFHDVRRVASFLSQFDQSGHLTQVTQGAGIARVKEDTGTVSAKGGVPLVIEGEGSHSTTASDEHRKDSQRVYDPVWANALTFLDYLSARDLIQNDIAEAGIGQFVLCRGALSISDLLLMSKTWQLPSVKKLMRQGSQTTNGGSRAERRRAASTGSNDAPDGLELFWDMVGVLPHTIQARLAGESQVWCSLQLQGLLVDASEITLKHGNDIPGEWAILGILDARPDDLEQEQPQVDVDFANPAEMAAKMMGVIAPLAKNLLGRPSASYGVTPLLVFREITGR